MSRFRRHPVSLRLNLGVFVFPSRPGVRRYSALPRGEGAGGPVMLAVKLRKEVILELDLLIEHLSSSGLIGCDSACVCPVICGFLYA